ncbi:putative F-box protein [Toxoplasma gondii RUB]|uniref:Putative F-box protein n=1 Tax=Toxoplasma gondii RUB TaxID=935652 RepID=A0A086LW22_TOXGO|nr:putative F-box protein [Toxoplasma gondii RUB]
MVRDQNPSSRLPFPIPVRTDAWRCCKKRELEVRRRCGLQSDFADSTEEGGKGGGSASPGRSHFRRNEKEKKPRRLREDLLAFSLLPEVKQRGTAKLNARAESQNGRKGVLDSQQKLAEVSSSSRRNDREETGNLTRRISRTGGRLGTVLTDCPECGGSRLEALPAGCMYTLFAFFDVSEVAELRLLSRTVKAVVDSPCSLRGCSSLTVTSKLAATARGGGDVLAKQRLPSVSTVSSVSAFWWRLLDRPPHVRRLVVCRDALGFCEGERAAFSPSHPLRFLLLLLHHNAALLDCVKVTSPDLQCHRLVDWGVLTPHARPEVAPRSRDTERHGGHSGTLPGVSRAIQTGDETEDGMREGAETSSGDVSDKGDLSEEGGQQTRERHLSETPRFLDIRRSLSHQERSSDLVEDADSASPELASGTRSETSLSSLLRGASSKRVSLPDWFRRESSPPSPLSRRLLSSLFPDGFSARGFSNSPEFASVGDARHSMVSAASPRHNEGPFSAAPPTLAAPLSLPATMFPKLTSLALAGCHAFLWLRLLSSSQFPSCETFSLVCQCSRVHVSLALDVDEEQTDAVSLKNPDVLTAGSRRRLSGLHGSSSTEAELTRMLLSMPVLRFLRLETRLPVTRRVWRAVLGCTYTAPTGEERRFTGLPHLTELAIRDRSLIHFADVVHEMANSPELLFSESLDRLPSSERVSPASSDFPSETRPAVEEELDRVPDAETLRPHSERAPRFAGERLGMRPNVLTSSRSRCHLKRLYMGSLGGELGKIPSVALASLEVLMRAFPDCQFVLDSFAAGCIHPGDAQEEDRHRRPEDDVAQLLPRILGYVQHIRLNFDDPDCDIPLLQNSFASDTRTSSSFVSSPASESSPSSPSSSLPSPSSSSSHLSLAPYARRVSVDFLHFRPDTHQGLFHCRFGSLPSSPSSPSSPFSPSSSSSLLPENHERGRGRCRLPSFCVEGLPEPESSPSRSPSRSRVSDESSAGRLREASHSSASLSQTPFLPGSWTSSPSRLRQGMGALFEQSTGTGSFEEAAPPPSVVNNKDGGRQQTVVESHVLPVLRSAAFPAFLLAPQRPPRLLGFASSERRRREGRRDARVAEEREDWEPAASRMLSEQPRGPSGETQRTEEAQGTAERRQERRGDTEGGLSRRRRSSRGVVRSFLARRRRRTQKRIDVDLLHALCRDKDLRSKVKGVELQLEELADAPRSASLVWALVDLRRKHREKEQSRGPLVHEAASEEGRRAAEGTVFIPGVSPEFLTANETASERHREKKPASGLTESQVTGERHWEDACKCECERREQTAEKEGRNEDEEEVLEPPRLELLRIGNHRFGLDEIPSVPSVNGHYGIGRMDENPDVGAAGAGSPCGSSSELLNSAASEGEKIAALFRELLVWYPEVETVELEVPPFLFDDEEDEAWREEPLQLQAMERLLNALGFARSAVETLGASMYEHVVVFRRRTRTL